MEITEILALIGVGIGWILTILGLGAKWEKAKSDGEEFKRQMLLLVSAYNKLIDAQKAANEDGKVTTEEFNDLMDKSAELAKQALDCMKTGDLLVEDIKDIYTSIMELVNRFKGEHA